MSRSWQWPENPGDMTWRRRISRCCYSRHLVLKTVIRHPAISFLAWDLAKNTSDAPLLPPDGYHGALLACLRRRRLPHITTRSPHVLAILLAPPPTPRYFTAWWQRGCQENYDRSSISRVGCAIAGQGRGPGGPAAPARRGLRSSCSPPRWPRPRPPPPLQWAPCPAQA